MPRSHQRTLSPKRRKLAVFVRQRKALFRILRAPNPAAIPYPPLEAARQRVFLILKGKAPREQIFSAMMEVRKAELARKQRYHQNLLRIVKYAEKLYKWYIMNFKNRKELQHAKALLQIVETHRPVVQRSENNFREIRQSLADFKEWDAALKEGRFPPEYLDNFIQNLSAIPPELMGLKDRQPGR